MGLYERAFRIVSEDWKIFVVALPSFHDCHVPIFLILTEYSDPDFDHASVSVDLLCEPRFRLNLFAPSTLLT